MLPLHPLIRETQERLQRTAATAERIGALEATVNRQASAIAALTVRTEWLEMMLQRTLEGHAPSAVCRSPSIEERVKNAQRVARQSRSPEPRGAAVGRMLPQDALLDKTTARGSDDYATTSTAVPVSDVNSGTCADKQNDSRTMIRYDPHGFQPDPHGFQPENSLHRDAS